MIWKTSLYGDLSKDELYAIMHARQEVFIVEQTCWYLDADYKDQEAYHVMAFQNDELGAYTRLLPVGVAYDHYVSIGRVLTRPAFRKKLLGKALMEYSIRQCRLLYGFLPIKISAQCYLDRFYNSFGFVKTGEEYLEDNIPHQAMILT